MVNLYDKFKKKKKKKKDDKELVEEDHPVHEEYSKMEPTKEG